MKSLTYIIISIGLFLATVIFVLAISPTQVDNKPSKVVNMNGAG